MRGSRLADGLIALRGGDRSPRRSRIDYTALDQRLEELARSTDPRNQALYRDLMDGEALPPRLLINAQDTSDDLKED